MQFHHTRWFIDFSNILGMENSLDRDWSPLVNIDHGWSGMITVSWLVDQHRLMLINVDSPSLRLKVKGQGQMMSLNINCLLTLEPFPKLLTLPVFWGPFGPQCSYYGLPIHNKNQQQICLTDNKNITFLVLWGPNGPQKTVLGLINIVALIRRQ